jgi:hypothetical protein
MRRVTHGDDCIAGRAIACARLALPAQANRLAVLNPDGDRDIERFPGRKRDPHFATYRHLGQRHRDRNADIFALCGSPRAATSAAAEQFRKHVGVNPVGPTDVPAPEIELKIAEVAPPRTGAKTLELRRSGFTLGIDFAAVESRPLLFVAENLVGLADLCKALFRLRLLALIRMILLRQLPERRLNLCGAGGLRQPENGIGIAHFEPSNPPAPADSSTR